METWMVWRKHQKLVEKAAAELVEVTGWQPWFARNVVIWRVARKLPVTITRAV